MCASSGPLNAVVNAQAQAAMSTVNFIRSIGFDRNNKTINVNFAYQSINASTGLVTKHTLSVPVLTILPIPYLRVSTVVVFGSWCTRPVCVVTHMT
jgi:hypothetical protein